MVGAKLPTVVTYNFVVPTASAAARAARNESVFRELNEQLEAASTGDPMVARGFVCECADISCTEVLALSLEEYAAVRKDSQRFIVAPEDSHVTPTIERVVERRDAYWVVEKLGVAGEVADQLHDS